MGKKHHENRTEKSTDIWLTPPWLIKSLGDFDLDPCFLADEVRPWDTAKKHYWEGNCGLSSPWNGRVWLNPPFNNQQGLWIDKLCEHGDGICLLPARTETKYFKTIWKKSQGVLFLPKRVKFYTGDGVLPKDSRPGFPVVLAAFGEKNVQSLIESGLGGALVVGDYIERSIDYS